MRERLNMIYFYKTLPNIFSIGKVSILSEDFVRVIYTTVDWIIRGKGGSGK